MTDSQADCAALVRAGRSWRLQFKPEPLEQYALTLKGIIARAVPVLADHVRPMRPAMDIAALEAVFGQFTPHHSFSHFMPDWALSLTEPQATKSLVHLLDRGPPDIRAKRIQAFLQALGVRHVPGLAQARRAEVKAEEPTGAGSEGGRIDIVVFWPREPDVPGRGAAVIEAKFGHHLTSGQLSNYRAYVKGQKDIPYAEYFLFGLSARAKKGLKGLQNSQWTFISWADLWLRFEKRRPVEDDPGLPVFLNLLWRRIGGLGK